MRRHPRRAAVDASHPSAWGTDDRSGFVGNQRNLQWQYEWAGFQLVSQGILVYEDQLDIPNRQLGSIVIPADPPAILNARVENYPIDELWPRMVEAALQHGALPRYLESSTVAGNTESIARELETSTIS